MSSYILSLTSLRSSYKVLIVFSKNAHSQPGQMIKSWGLANTEDSTTRWWKAYFDLKWQKDLKEYTKHRGHVLSALDFFAFSETPKVLDRYFPRHSLFPLSIQLFSLNVSPRGTVGEKMTNAIQPSVDWVSELSHRARKYSSFFSMGCVWCTV